MKVKLLKDMGVNGEHCKAGDVVDVEKHDGYYLCSGRKAVEVKDEPKPEVKAKVKFKK